MRDADRAADQFGQVIDVLVAARRDAAAARRLLLEALGATKATPVEVAAGKAATDPVALDGLLPAAWHRTDQHANNRVACGHGRLKARLGPVGGLTQERGARVIIVGHALVQDVRRAHYELAVDAPARRRLAVAFDELAVTI